MVTEEVVLNWGDLVHCKKGGWGKQGGVDKMAEVGVRKEGLVRRMEWLGMLCEC